MDIGTDFQASLLMPQKAIPKLGSIQTDQEVLRAAHDFTGVFFSEYVALMLEEVETDEDDDGSYEVFKGLHAQVLGEKLVSSPAGQKLTDTLISAIQKLQGNMS